MSSRRAMVLLIGKLLSSFMRFQVVLCEVQHTLDPDMSVKRTPQYHHFGFYHDQHIL